jgi:hypothetical protein
MSSDPRRVFWLCGGLLATWLGVACLDENVGTKPDNPGPSAAVAGDAGAPASGGNQVRCTANGTLSSCNYDTHYCFQTPVTSEGYGPTIEQAGAAAKKNCAERMEDLIRISVALPTTIISVCAVTDCE